MNPLRWLLSLVSRPRGKTQTPSADNRLTQDNAEWWALFGKYEILDKRFNPANFPLEPREQMGRVEEASFSEWLAGTEILHRIAVAGNGLPRLRACGEYLAVHLIRPHYPVIASGAQWTDPQSRHTLVPVFQNWGDKIVVSLHWLDCKYIPTCKWLMRPPAGK